MMDYQTILNAIPMPAFVVDEDVAIQDLNSSAASFCGEAQEEAHGQRGGAVLRCLHSTDVPEGCGRGPLCKNCVIRNSVRNCLESCIVSRKVMHFQRLNGKVTTEMQVLITASPLAGEDKKLALVMVEDISDRRKPLYNVTPAIPLSGDPKLAHEIEWQPRPRPLRSFPEDAQVRLRQLEFNRIITLCVDDVALHIKRIGLDKFMCSEA